jgi:hypothetical protein
MLSGKVHIKNQQLLTSEGEFPLPTELMGLGDKGFPILLIGVALR